MERIRKKLILLAALALSALIIFTAYYLGLFGAHVVLRKATFAELPNWEQDDHRQAVVSFQQSCGEILKRNAKAQNWKMVCAEATKLSNLNASDARRFFETWFEPYSVTNNFNPQGLFTGYYLPLVHASLKKSAYYSIPIYGLPKNLKIYPDRTAINAGALDNIAPILAWGNDKVDVFFAQIQGSAIAVLPNGKSFLLSYAGGNGHPYTAIGKVLIEKHALTKKTVSMQTIRAWLLQHPEQIDAVLNRNASYVFFQKLKNTNPSGMERVPLTIERSLAVDTRYIPLGAPIWLDTVAPIKNNLVSYQHLLVAQDTGGAIRGVVRGDVYWGDQMGADEIAGQMKSPGRYWILLPTRRSS